MKDTQLDAHIVEYFWAIFSTSSDRGPIDFSTVIEGRVIREMWSNLECKVVAVEITKSLHQMHPNKASGLDGMSPTFFQKYWGTIGSIVTTTLLRALNSGQFPIELNYTLITLIPKKRQPLSVKD